MHFATKFAVAVAAIAAGVNAQLTVNSPAALIQCQPVQLSWSGSTAGGPYFVALIPGGQASAAPLEDIGEVENSPYTWNVNLAAGTEVTIRVIDSSGQPQYSDPITIQESSNSDCVGGGSSASGSATGSASGASESGASPTGSQSGSASPTGSGAAETSAPNGAGAISVGSLTGLAGLLVAAVGVIA